MLDSGVGSASPLPIVVGRVLSAYTVGAVQNHQETITYTVYNEQADPESGVLLTTVLEPGVTITSAANARSERSEPGVEPGDDRRIWPGGASRRSVPGETAPAPA